MTIPTAPPTFSYPGVYLTEIASVTHTVSGAATSNVAFVGTVTTTALPAGQAPAAAQITSWADFVATFFPTATPTAPPTMTLTSLAVSQFFLNGGGTAFVVDLGGALSPAAYNTGVTAALAAGGPLDQLAPLIVNLLVLPDAAQLPPAAPPAPPAPAAPAAPAGGDGGGSSGGGDSASGDGGGGAADDANGGGGAPAPAAGGDTGAAAAALDATFIGNALTYCRTHQAFLLVDGPPPAGAAAPANGWTAGAPVTAAGADDGKAVIAWAGSALNTENYYGALYYPWVQITDPYDPTKSHLVPPSGTVAGVYASTDASRGVWKAPAGVTTAVQGVTALADTAITDTVSGALNLAAVNALRTFPIYGSVVWGARTMGGAATPGQTSAWTYVAARRLADFIETSLMQSLRWAVFEPNGPALWSSIALEVNGFMSGLYAQGAFEGATAAAAYRVACDATTTTADDMANGFVHIVVGFAPVGPAEFVWLDVQVGTQPTAS